MLHRVSVRVRANDSRIRERAVAMLFDPALIGGVIVPHPFRGVEHSSVSGRSNPPIDGLANTPIAAEELGQVFVTRRCDRFTKTLAILPKT